MAAKGKTANVGPAHPGVSIAETVLDKLGLTQDQLAKLTGVSRRTINQLVNFRRNLTADMALRIAKVTGTNAREWLEQQIAYDLHQTEVALGKILAKIPHASSAKAVKATKAEPKPVEAKKLEPKKAEPKKAEPKKAEPKKAAAKKVPAKKAAAEKPVVKAEPKKAAPKKAAAAKPAAAPAVAPTPVKAATPKKVAAKPAAKPAAKKASKKK